MSTKYLDIIDLNLFSGSGETFRTAVGGYFEIVSGTYGEDVDTVAYESGSVFDDFISSVSVNVDLEDTIDLDVIVPNKQFPVRLVGDENYVKSDIHWKTVLLGGTFGADNYRSTYTDSVFDENSFTYNIPYSQMESLTVADIGSSFTDVTQISYDYNQYINTYENYAHNTSELLMPNGYLLKAFEMSMSSSSDLTLSSSIADFVTLEGALEDEDVAKIFTTSSMLTAYYSSSLQNYPLSSSTIIQMEKRLQNIFFDADVLADLNSPYYELKASRTDLPFYMFVDFTTTAPGDILESIETNNFSQKFLKILKESFLGEIDDLSPSTGEYIYSTEYYSGSANEETYSTVRSAANVAMKTVDFLKMLTYAYRNYNSMTDNCHFYGGESFSRTAVMDTNGTYRHINAVNTTEVLNDTIDYLYNTSNFEITSIEDLYNLDTGTEETLAYRIEKIYGPTSTTGPQNVIQNYWFFNSAEISNLDFFDSQIKYEQDYTYNIYAYVLVLGKKYGFSDFRLTKQIGNTKLAPPSDTATVEQEYPCLEFYDPITNEPAEQLLYSWEDNYLSSSNTYATNAQLVGADLYYADFNLNYEANLKIFEVPVASKTLRILDNPPNTFDVSPYHIIDASQTIGFTISYEIFYDELGYPSDISEEDRTRKIRYLHGKDLIGTSDITLESVSRQRWIEVYRVDTKPTSISDFDGKRIKLVSMINEGEEFSYSTIEIRDRIKTNQKYYYLFRILNDQNMPSPLSVIYEAQLIDDGGYVYSIFNILFEEELELETHTEPFKQFKKLFQLQPNISHLVLDTEGVDFSDTAYSQLENVEIGVSDDSIWNKTFKLKLTSKKTGKKIDFNVTYNLQR